MNIVCNPVKTLSATKAICAHQNPIQYHFLIFSSACAILVETSSIVINDKAVFFIIEYNGLKDTLSKDAHIIISFSNIIYTLYMFKA